MLSGYIYYASYSQNNKHESSLIARYQVCSLSKLLIPIAAELLAALYYIIKILIEQSVEPR